MILTTLDKIKKLLYFNELIKLKEILTELYHSSWNLGVIEAGTNITFSGDGTQASPLVINSSGGGTTPTLNEVTTVGNTTVNIIGAQAIVTGLGIQGVDISEDGVFVRTNISGVNGIIKSDNVTGEKEYQLPNNSGTIALVSDVTTASSTLQPLDSDLTTISGLTPSNDDFIQRKSGVWVNRNVTQVKADLGLSDYVLNTGNTVDVNLGANNLTANILIANNSAIKDNGIDDGLYDAVNDAVIATYDEANNIYNYARGTIKVDFNNNLVKVEKENIIVGTPAFPNSLGGLFTISDDGTVSVGDGSLIGNGTHIKVRDSFGTINLVANNGIFLNGSKAVIEGVDNSTTVVLSSATLTSTYPTAQTGFKVYCTSIIAGKMIYEKTPSGWVGYACIIP